jgi:hypothetical protein
MLDHDEYFNKPMKAYKDDTQREDLRCCGNCCNVLIKKHGIGCLKGEKSLPVEFDNVCDKWEFDSIKKELREHMI